MRAFPCDIWAVQKTVRAFQAAGRVRTSDLDAPFAPVPPWDLASTSHPLDVEIGCGVGWHPLRYALENPERRLIAIEHTRAKFTSFAQRLRRHEERGERPSNLWPIHADAMSWVAHQLPLSALDRVIFMYPNPEPKAPNKRWLRAPFFRRLLESLKSGGEVWLVTNESSYFVEALDFANREWGLTCVFKRAFDRAHGVTPRTHFEKKYLARGETCFEAHWRKS